MLYRRLLAAALAMALLLTGCSSSGRGNLFYDITSGITSYDPQMAEDDSAMLIAGNCFEGLLHKGSDGSLFPGAAESWTVSPDGLTYTFRLKSGMVWSDGETKLTADDFVFGFRRLFDPATGAPFSSDFTAMKNAEHVLSGSLPVQQLGVSAPDALTLVITLSRQDPFFLDLLATPAASPCNEEFFLSTRGRYGSTTEYIMFNGPYCVARIKENVYYRLSRNPSYSGASASYSNVYLYTQTGEGYSAADRLLDESIDAAPVEYGDLEALTAAGFSVSGYKNTIWVLAFNTADQFMSSQNIRRAIAYACDRDAMGGLLPGNLELSETFVPPAVTLSGESYRSLAGTAFSGFEYDPEAAAGFLAAGQDELDAGRPDTVTIMCPEEYLPALGLIQRSVQEALAVFVNLSPAEPQELEDAVLSGGYQIALIPITVQYNTPAAFFSMFASDTNITGYSSAALTAAVQSAACARTLNSTVEAYATAEQMLLQACPVYPMFFEESYFAHAPGVPDMTYSPFGNHLEFFYAH